MLYYNTVNDFLKETLFVLMKAEVFRGFRLVGGTALSLQLGHRQSVDIDLFSDTDYGSIDFSAIEHFLKTMFSYVLVPSKMQPAMGKSYLIGKDENNTVKLDVFCTDPFIQSPLIVDEIRLASIDEIVAMKIDVVQRFGRKKDFWDLHELLDKYSVEEMLALHEKRYEYTHDRILIFENLTDFEQANEEIDPICLHGKFWDIIKADIITWSKK